MAPLSTTGLWRPGVAAVTVVQADGLVVQRSRGWRCTVTEDVCGLPSQG